MNGYQTISLQFTPYNGKIADITESDTNKHTADISAYVPANCVAVIVRVERITGTGYLELYPNEETQRGAYYFDVRGYPLAIINQRIQYQLSVANDDFDLYMFGYFTEG